MVGERESEQLGLMGWVEPPWPSQGQNHPLKESSSLSRNSENHILCGRCVTTSTI